MAVTIEASSSSASMSSGSQRVLHAVQRVAHAFDPDGVRIEHEERLAFEIRQRLQDAAAGAEQFVVLFRDADFDVLALCQMRLQHVGFVMRVDDDHRHARSDQPVDRVIDQRLARHLTSGLGRSLVSGRMRVPSPAAITIARVGPFTVDAPSISPRRSRGMVLSYHDLSAAKRRMFEIAVQMSPHARQIGEIARLAVSFVKAREDAGDLGVALRRHDGHLRAEVSPHPRRWPRDSAASVASAISGETSRRASSVSEIRS